MIKILLADDDAVERTALRSLLKDEFDVEIIEANDGQQALDLLCDGLRPGLSIVDLKMPKLTGLELIQRLRRDPQLGQLRIMASSASRDRDTIVSLAKLRIHGYLLKPYDRDKTLTQVRQAIADLLSAPDPTRAARNLLAKTILIVDDDEVSRTALRDIIRSFGHFEILESKDGQECLTRLYGGLRPDLIYADLLMPRLDGFSLLQRIRDEATLRALKVVMCSSDNDRDRVRALAQLQVSGYLLKPFEPPKVLQTLKVIPDVELIVPTPPKAPDAPPPAPAESDKAPAPETKVAPPADEGAPAVPPPAPASP